MVSFFLAVLTLVYTGRLVPRATYEDMRKDRDYWREALQVKMDTVSTKVDQNTTVAGELTKTVDSFFDSLQPPERERRPRGPRP